jgi:hypothetical protein
MASDEIDELNWRPPPTTGLATRHFRGTDPAEMLRQVADYIDRANPGRTIVGLWCVPPSDGSEEGLEFEVIVDHDEDAYAMIIDDDKGMIEVEGFEEMLIELRDQSPEPGMWRLMATVDDEATATLLREAFRTTAEERRRTPPEAFGFECRQVESGKFQVYGRFEPPAAE